MRSCYQVCSNGLCNIAEQHLCLLLIRAVSVVLRTGQASTSCTTGCNECSPFALHSDCPPLWSTLQTCVVTLHISQAACSMHWVLHCRQTRTLTCPKQSKPTRKRACGAAGQLLLLSCTQGVLNSASMPCCFMPHCFDYKLSQCWQSLFPFHKVPEAETDMVSSTYLLLSMQQAGQVPASK